MDILIGQEQLRIRIEDLLPLLMFAVIWWVSSRRAKKRTDRVAPPSARATARSGPDLSPRGEERVDPFELLRQMLFGGMELPPLPTEPPAAAEKSRLYADQEAVRTKPERERETKSAEWLPRDAATPQTEEMRGLPRQQPKARTTVQRRPGYRARGLVRVSRQELQRAVIWSELLAPPVGLRDE